MPVEAHDPTFSRQRVHDAKPVLVKQRVKLRAQGAKAARLHFDELAIGTNQIDHEPADRHLQPVTRLRQYRLDRSLQRPFAHDPMLDTTHRLAARSAPTGRDLGSTDHFPNSIGSTPARDLGRDLPVDRYSLILPSIIDRGGSMGRRKLRQRRGH